MLVSAEKPAGAAMLDVQAVAAMLSVSPRTVYRLADAGRMPSPVKLGVLSAGTEPPSTNGLVRVVRPCGTSRRAVGNERSPRQECRTR